MSPHSLHDKATWWYEDSRINFGVTHCIWVYMCFCPPSGLWLRSSKNTEFHLDGGEKPSGYSWVDCPRSLAQSAVWREEWCLQVALPPLPNPTPSPFFPLTPIPSLLSKFLVGQARLDAKMPIWLLSLGSVCLEPLSSTFWLPWCLNTQPHLTPKHDMERL